MERHRYTSLLFFILTIMALALLSLGVEGVSSSSRQAASLQAAPRRAIVRQAALKPMSMTKALAQYRVGRQRIAVHPRQRTSVHSRRHGVGNGSKLTYSASTLQMLSLINVERIRAHERGLTLDSTLCKIAQARSQDMIDRNYFSHVIPGKRPSMVFDILDKNKVGYTMVGENIALNNYVDFYSMTKTVAQTNGDLMNSPEHRANLLEPRFTELGLGMAFGKNGKLIVTEVFVQP